MHCRIICPCLSPRRHSTAGFALSEVIGVLFIVSFLSLVLWMIFPDGFGSREKVRQAGCLSNLKQMGSAFLLYSQDNDDRFPPPTGGSTQIKILAASWGPDYDVRLEGNKSQPITVPGLLSPYSDKGNAIFRCPDTAADASLTYLYNDLAAGEVRKLLSGADNTVLVAEGEDQWRNAGHAWTPSEEPHTASFDYRGRCSRNRGATVKDAVRRHSGGADYLFADGHVKWLQPEKVFFPGRRSNQKEHLSAGKIVGPDPAGTMTFEGKIYKATFHVR
jgi:prepilin-type processing-associated H-X9-DG protein